MVQAEPGGVAGTARAGGVGPSGGGMVAPGALWPDVLVALARADDQQVLAAVDGALARIGAACGSDRVDIVRVVPAVGVVIRTWTDVSPQARRDPASFTAGTQAWVDAFVAAGQPFVRAGGANTGDDDRDADAVALRRLLQLGAEQAVAAVPLRPDPPTGPGVLAVCGGQNLVLPVDDLGHLADVGEVLLAALERSAEGRRAADDARELRTRNDGLLQTNSQLESFTRVAAHDLKSPLTMVQMAMQGLEARLAEPVDLELLGAAQRSAGRMAVLIDDLLAFALTGSDAGNPIDVDLDLVLQAVVDDCRIGDEGATLHVGPLPAVSGHPSQLRVLFQNLVANALKFRRPGEAPAVRVLDRTADPLAAVVEIVVEDDGIGIPSDRRAEVLRPFVRLSRRDDYPGTGLGLATCQRIVDNHGGTLRVDESQSGGTAIFVTLSRAL